MITIFSQESYMLGKMIERQEADFKKFGGIRERMHAARTAARGEEFDKGLYSRLNAEQSVDALLAQASELKRKIDRAVWSIRKRKGW